MSQFASALITWQRKHGRRGLPWQGTRDPYRIWLSEVMLQQTQVAAVIPYYRRFLDKYPTVKALAMASEDEVLKLWSGLGYYARGRNLHLASQEIALELGGKFPDSSEKLGRLPGIGRSTAAAIAAFAFGERAAILDGNVKRVLARHNGIPGFPGEKSVEARLWKLAESLLPKKNIQVYTQALMDLGATVCVKGKPRCDECPVRSACIARKKGLTETLPAPRPRKVLPVRRATWFVYVRDGEVLLERRPGHGLWGGLWTFPEKRVYRSAKSRTLPSMKHGFTHFRLHIQPILFKVRKSKSNAEAPGQLWLGFAEAASAAVPAPVRTLLGRLPAAR